MNFIYSGVLLVFWYILLGPFYQFSKDDSVLDIDKEYSLSIMSFNARSFNELKQMDNDNLENEI